MLFARCAFVRLCPAALLALRHSHVNQQTKYLSVFKKSALTTCSSQRSGMQMYNMRFLARYGDGVPCDATIFRPHFPLTPSTLRGYFFVSGAGLGKTRTYALGLNVRTKPGPWHHSSIRRSSTSRMFLGPTLSWSRSSSQLSHQN